MITKNNFFLLILIFQTSSLLSLIFEPLGWRHHVLKFNRNMKITEQEAKKEQDFIDVYYAFKQAQIHLNALLKAKSEFEHSTPALRFFLNHGFNLYIPGRVYTAVLRNNYQNAQLLVGYIQWKISEIDKEIKKLARQLNIR